MKKRPTPAPEHPKNTKAKKTREQVSKATAPKRFEEAKQEAMVQGISQKQWRDLMHVIEAKGENVWPNIIKFKSGKIRLVESWDLSLCTKIKTLPKGLEGETVYLSRKLERTVQQRIERLVKSGKIGCRVLFL